ncbi:uncharacterized protein V1513DRAFT_437294 [Lipomyces chichibuensis]|uniref:uncharacterized protein n=1 Tax=Lipomyces chichibuensis TaxID=1546026 RepID=UPI003343037D
MNIFAICFPCCACRRRRHNSPASDPHPSYFFDFNFYAEQMRDGVPQPRRISSFDSISLVGDDGSGVDELTTLLSSRRGSRPRGRMSWFDGWFPRISSRGEYVIPFCLRRSNMTLKYSRSRNQRSYNATSTKLSKTRTRTPSLISTASFLTPSRRNSLGNFYYDEADDMNGDGARSEQYEDFGLADAQIVPDNFVVSVPLRPTKSANTVRANDNDSEVSSFYGSLGEGSIRSSIHSEQAE